VKRVNGTFSGLLLEPDPGIPYISIHMKLRFAGTKIYLGLSVAALVLLVDQLSKSYIRHTMQEWTTRPVIGSFLRFTYINNPGGIFGVSFGNAFPYDIVSAVAIGLLFVLVLRERRKINMISYGLLLGGSLGNLWDRIFHVRITDFIDIGIGETFRGLVFNLADFAIVAGLVVFLSATLLRNRFYSRKLARNPEQV
jgi:signal peptidase II